MIRLIKFLFTGDWHLHEWEIIKEISVWDESKKFDKYPAKYEYVLQCKKCGDIKVEF